MTRPEPNYIDGLLLLDKPQDWTSFDVVNLVKRRFHLSKTGHCGTLDPLATGLLVVLCGRATRLQDSLMGQNKVYQATMRLGIETDSEDRTGLVTSERSLDGVTEARVRETAAGFLGEQTQIPPMVSAVKLHGQPLYKLARRGEVVERAPRPVTILGLEITRVALPDVDFTLTCSKGTYVRTLCADWGRVLGCGGHMLELRRVRSGKLDVSSAHSVEAVRSWDADELRRRVMPLEEVAALYSAGEPAEQGRVTG